MTREEKNKIHTRRWRDFNRDNELCLDCGEPVFKQVLDHSLKVYKKCRRHLITNAQAQADYRDRKGLNKNASNSKSNRNTS